MFYKFILSGSSVELLQLGELYLDVGNSLTTSIIDHHQLLNIQKSATRLVYENPKFILKETHTIILHNSPDLDCIASSYLAQNYIKNGSFPEFAFELAEFLDKTDFGKKTSTLINLNSLFSIIKSSCRSDQEIVQRGHQLLEDLAPLGFDSGKYPLNFHDTVKEIESDYTYFLEDMKLSKIEKCCIQERFTKQFIVVDSLVLYNPQSKLFKFWARDIGFDLLIVQWNNQRTVISIKGDSYLTLEDIGSKINIAEQTKREQLSIIVDENPREGYDIPDPWYDGRGHSYTIIDSPRRGTELQLEDIIYILKESKGCTQI